ncbi:uncharacterized [Tachysurus ichikawai]
MFVSWGFSSSIALKHPAARAEPSARSRSKRTGAGITLRGRRSLKRVARACLTSSARALVLKKGEKRKSISGVLRCTVQIHLRVFYVLL